MGLPEIGGGLPGMGGRPAGDWREDPGAGHAGMPIMLRPGAPATPAVIAWITPNAISGHALGCSFALADGLMSKSPTRGHSTMKNHRSLRHIIMQAGGSAGGAHRGPSAGNSRIWMMRGILVLALGLGGLAATVLALPAHVSAG